MKSRTRKIRMSHNMDKMHWRRCLCSNEQVSTKQLKGGKFIHTSPLMFSQILLMILRQNGGYQSSVFLKEHTTEILKNRLLHRNM